MTESINEIRVAVKEGKIQAKVDVPEITELRGWLDKCRKEKNKIAREEQIQFETKLLEVQKF